MPIIGKSLSKTSKTCSKNLHNHSWIDLFVTDRSKSFQNSMVVAQSVTNKYECPHEKNNQCLFDIK